MNDKYVELTSESLKEITYGVRSLNQEQRELVRRALAPYVGKQLWENDLKRILREFKESRALSSIDMDALREAFFAGER